MDFIKKYPLLFPKRVEISTQAGWDDILDRLFNEMAQDNPPVSVLQVKEKFGSLRVYYSGGSQRSHEAYVRAYDEADRTCEVCGKPGAIRDGPWLRARCDEHVEP